jgi:hypothetical protein
MTDLFTTADTLEIPAFLRRGHPDCVVKEGDPWTAPPRASAPVDTAALAIDAEKREALARRIERRTLRRAKAEVKRLQGEIDLIDGRDEKATKRLEALLRDAQRTVYLNA